jgi:hypothetical protein
VTFAPGRRGVRMFHSTRVGSGCGVDHLAGLML